MLKFIGQYAECDVMIDSVEDTAAKQIQSFLDCAAFAGCKIKIMPDVHAGSGAVIGFTSTLGDKIIPNVIGVDIGCGVFTCDLPYCDVDFSGLDKFIRQSIPYGFNIHNKYDNTFIYNEKDIVNVAKETNQDPSKVLRSIGTLGGGNHFIELGKDIATNKLWLTIHTGSRNFGLKIANYHQNIAKSKVGPQNGLEWLEGKDAALYFRHMNVAQTYAEQNRMAIADKIFNYLGVDTEWWHLYYIESVHNYIDFDDGIIRKGAIAARDGERLVIPWNMRDGLIIGKGKSNPQWNMSAPHGAGRVLGRNQAKKTLSLAEFQKSMQNVWTSCVNQDTIDESPMVYKDCNMIKNAIGDTLTITNQIVPVYNFKAS